MSSRVQPEDYKDYTVAELKSILKERRQPVSGTKTELVERLYNSYTVAELKIILKEEGLPVSGKKADMLERLQIQLITKHGRDKTGAVSDSGVHYSSSIGSWDVKGDFTPTTTSIGGASVSYILEKLLRPKDETNALSNLRIYWGVGLLLLVLARFGPWFVFNSEISDDGCCGKTFDREYGLLKLQEKENVYLNWDVTESSSEGFAYSENSGQFEKRQNVAFTVLILVGIAVFIMAIPNAVFLHLARRNLAKRSPVIADLRNLKDVQKKLVFLWKKMTSLQGNNIGFAGLIPLLKKIEKDIPTTINEGMVPIRDQKFVKCIAAVSTIAIIICLAAGLYFGVKWLDAMGEDACAYSYEEGGLMNVYGSNDAKECSVVQGFRGTFHVPYTGTYLDSEGYYHTSGYTLQWGGGWARALVLWIEPLILFGIFYNCRKYLRFSEKQSREYSSLIASTQDFEKPDFSGFFEENDVNT